MKSIASIAVGRKLLLPAFAFFAVFAFSFFFLALTAGSCFAAASTQTGFAVSFPATEPDIVEKTAQLDKAAIVMINSIVTGTIQIPSYTLVEGGTTGAAALVGTWRNAAEQMVFNADGSFTDVGQTYNYHGTYAVTGNQITLYFSQLANPLTGTYSISGDALTLNFPSLQVSATYTRVGAAPAGGGTDVVENAKNLMIVKDEGTGAKMLSADLMSGASGTGFVVSSDGYIVTNAHVVLADQKPEDMLVNALFNSLANQIYNDAAQYYNIPPEDKDQIVKILLGKFVAYFQEYGQITDVTTNYYVLNGVANPGEDLKVKSWISALKKEGTVYEKIGTEYSWGRDIAVLKVDKTGLPTVRLGDSNNVQVGEKLFIIGYPDTQLTELFKPESLLEPTVTQGIVSARRTLKNGLDTIQTDAAINHGNSGGPVFNDRGEVIGIATFGAGPETGIEAIKFAMPINLAKEYLNELNVKNEETAIDKDYSEALAAFWKKDCYAALPKLQDVLVLYPGHPYAQDYVNACERAIQAGEIQKPVDYGVITIVVIVIAVAAAAFYFFKKKGVSLPSMPSIPSTLLKPGKPSAGAKKGVHFCASCGAPLKSGEKFCDQCGNRL